MNRNLDHTKRCACKRKAVLGLGVRNYRIMCRHCGIGTKPSGSIDKAVERWNNREIEQLPSFGLSDERKATA